MTKRFVLITGVTSGIGREFAIQLSEKGYSIIGIGRREDRLKELENILASDYTYRVCDITSDFDIVLRLFSKYDIEIVINNAGFGYSGEFSEIDESIELKMIETNIVAMHRLAKASIEYFLKKGSGYLLNVSSSAGLFPAGPYMATYYATKAYVSSLSTAIAAELSERDKKRIFVGQLCPGPVDTEFNSVANVKFSLKGISADKCVAYAIRKMLKGKEIIVPGFIMRTGIFMTRFIPRKLAARLTGMQQKRKMGE